ncbi:MULTISPECIES: hypothetical protein [Streptomyces]|uniref:Uncharacterized protein n=2 Tax=Streptomyces TaxID=1883 RepID=A0ABU4K128_9ACTN|nr:hypothetical protein [Streptomyces roseolus]MDX2291449.1 hypothetical protein [Streptomyces roseolus]
MRAVSAGVLADGWDAFLAAGGDDADGAEPAADADGAELATDFDGAEPAAEVGACLVAAHEDDLLCAAPLGREDRRQSDGAGADHRDAGACADAAGDGGAVAGADDVRQGQQGRTESGARPDDRLDERAVVDRDADRFSLTALVRRAVPEPACGWAQEVWRPSRQKRRSGRRPRRERRAGRRA